MNSMESEINNEPSLSLEAALFGLAALLALGLRLFHLGAAPLSEAEAGWAMQAFQAAHPDAGAAAFGSQPAYIFLTGLAFFVFGATDLTARLLPALAGVSLVCLPYLFRRRLGRAAALALAFGLALDPGLVTLSRQAGGPMPAVAFVLLALGLWQARRPVWAGILGGLALLCGPATLLGLLAGSLGWGALRLFARQTDGRNISPGSQADDPRLPESEPTPGDAPAALAPLSLPQFEGEGQTPAPARTARPPRLAPALRAALLSGLATFVLVGTAFLTRPQGLAAALGALPDFLSSWVRPALTSAGQIMGLLPVYAPLALILAGVALARWAEARFLQNPAAHEPPATPAMWVFFGAALLLILLYPGRQPGDLAWALVPLWGAAAIGLAAYLPLERPHPLVGIQVGLTLTLAALMWIWLSSSETMIPANTEVWWALRPAIVIGILALSALTTALIALGWGWAYARDGLVWGLVASFAIYATAALWGAAYLRPNQPQELWSRPPAPGQERLLLDTLAQLSDHTRGLPNEIEVVALVDTASLRWALRGYPQARFVNSLPAGEQPALVITRQQDQLPALAAGYRGQDFVWWVRPGWEGALPPNLIPWLAYRQAPVMNEYLIVWARNDLFP